MSLFLASALDKNLFRVKYIEHSELCVYLIRYKSQMLSFPFLSLNLFLCLKSQEEDLSIKALNLY